MSSIYQRLVEKRGDDASLKRCMEATIDELLSKDTDAEHPGMMLGDIQSGKTRAFTGVIALGFDKKYDIAVVITKGTKALVKQTVLRLKSEFREFEIQDEIRIFDIMEMPEDLNDFIIEKQKLILVAKKEDDNINRLKKIFFETYPSLHEKNILIVDDEADFVSIGYSNKKNDLGEKELSINVISKQISDFRKSLKKGSDYLQVTATPYSLYLQPEDIKIQDTLFAPMRPKFTIVLPRHGKYIGSDFYFEESKKSNSPAQYLFQAINEEELKALTKTHGKILENVLTSPSVFHFRSAISNYLVGSCIRILQAEREGIKNYKSSFIVHTGTGKNVHKNQAVLINKLVEALRIEGKMKSSWLREKLEESYANIKLSVALTDFVLPEFNDVFEKACEYIKYIIARVVNSETDVISILNLDTGELRMDSAMNIFIGGQILDRGITVQNLIGFFYGRNPKRMQQDTVMQHARIFGARTKEDMAVTRLYTTNRIYEAMRRMHEADRALREAFEKEGARKKVAFIQKSVDGKIVPCSPNKLLISNTVTLKPESTLPIYGFQTSSKSQISQTISSISKRLNALSNSQIESPFMLSIKIAKELIDLVYSTFENQDEIYGCTREEFKAVLEYTCEQSAIDKHEGFVYCFSNIKPKNNARYKDNIRGIMFNDVCYDGRTDAKKAKDVAIDIPCLFLSFQDGKRENGWKDAQFYWPVLFVQKKLVTSIFTTETDPGNPTSEDDDLTDDTGPMHK